MQFGGTWNSNKDNIVYPVSIGPLSNYTHHHDIHCNHISHSYLLFTLSIFSLVFFAAGHEISS